MVNAFVYLRVSGIGQVSGDGFDRQLEACEQYAALNGLTITRIFREEGVSGTKDLVERPALCDLMAELQESGTRTIVIEKLDRLARDLMVSETIIADIQKQRFNLISVAEPDLCSTDPSRKLVRQIFSAIAEYDRAMTVLKLRGARQRMKAKTGRCEGQLAFGMKAGERPTLDGILSKHAAGMNSKNIAIWLNASGIHTRGGGHWHPSTVAKILHRHTVPNQFRNLPLQVVENAMQ
jgi:DNA invertase Pin-like site-specific DNA recombinase